MAMKIKTRAVEWLDETWREMRNGAGMARMAYMGGAIDLLKDLDVLNVEEQEAWIERRRHCPGHDDEGGRDWCAYGCDMTDLKARGEAM